MTEQIWFSDEVADFGTAIHESAVYDGPCAATDSVADDAAAPEPAAAVPADETGFTAYSTGEAALRGGDIVVTTTESGLPLALRVDPGQLRRDPADLADDLLRLCRLAANRAGLTRRKQLSGLGMSDQSLDLLGLPTQDAVEQAELGDENDYEFEPRSWLDRDGSVW
ncbi:hypothetical protein [Nocardia sp. NPDC051570]|uniref:hypothetical protein n=1 Tax=Nocardia sp. NPDC051570 TaxID=3364324 RepID=UPI0037A16CD9